MLSNLIRVSLVLIGFSPILVSAWVINIFRNWNKFYFSIRLDSIANIKDGATEILKSHYLILTFILICLGTNFLVRYAVNTLPIGSFDVKQIKPADNNFLALFFSIVLPFFKFAFFGLNDLIYIIGFFVISLLWSLTANSSYHFNIILRLILGYKHYEVQTRKEVSYLVLSKAVLIRPDQFTKYVYITNHMLINVS